MRRMTLQFLLSSELHTPAGQGSGSVHAGVRPPRQLTYLMKHAAALHLGPPSRQRVRRQLQHVQQQAGWHRGQASSGSAERRRRGSRQGLAPRVQAWAARWLG